jgi:hypothetical protein
MVYVRDKLVVRSVGLGCGFDCKYEGKVCVEKHMTLQEGPEKRWFVLITKVWYLQ